MEEEFVRTRKAAISRRAFLKGSAVAGAAAVALYGGLKFSGALSSGAKGKIVIVGGGAAGISAAARLESALRSPDITLIDPSELHYYQPGFTLIAAGVYSPEEVYRKQADCIPSGVKWLKDSAVAIDPDKRTVSTAGGLKVPYDFLVLTPGMVCDWDLIEGIDAKSLGTGNAHCIYDFEGAIKTRAAMEKFAREGGVGIFADTYTKHKCGGAPKKVCLLTEQLSRKCGARKNAEFNFYTAADQLYDVPHFTPRLLEIYAERNVPINLNTHISGIDTSAKRVFFVRKQKGADGKTVVSEFKRDYDFIHFLPPMGAPKFVKESGLSATSGSHAKEGWVDVDKYTLVSKKYPNIVSFGDVSSLPTSKTSAAIRKQVPVAVNNLICLMEGREPSAKYDGYAACPIVTDYGHVLLCEFDYDKKPKISFPFSLLDKSKESRAAWFLKVYALKPMYFYGMLNGLA